VNGVETDYLVDPSGGLSCAHGERMADLSNLRAAVQRRRNFEQVDDNTPAAPVGDVDS
jgi:hypothetical protein